MLCATNYAINSKPQVITLKYHTQIVGGFSSIWIISSPATMGLTFDFVGVKYVVKSYIETQVNIVKYFF